MILSLVLVGAAPLAAPLAQDSASCAFTDVSIVDVDTGAVVPGQTVVVREGRIVALGATGEVAVPDDAVRIDGAGCWLMPGLADMHVHSWTELELPLFLANGVTTIRNLFGGPVHIEWRDEIERGERLGPTIYTAGPIVDGAPPTWPGSIVVGSMEDGWDAVAENVDGGYDFIKVYNGIPLEAYEALTNAAAEVGLPVMGHVPDAVGLQAALEAGQRTIEHLSGYDVFCTPDSDGPNPLEDWAELDPSRLEAACALTKAAGTWNCPTLVVFEKMLTEEGIEAELALPRMRFVSPATRETWRGMGAQRSTFARWVSASETGRRAVVRALHEAGARIVLGTD